MFGTKKNQNTRHFVTEAVRIWSYQLSASERSNWQRKAPHNVTGFNCFLKNYLKTGKAR